MVLMVDDDDDALEIYSMLVKQTKFADYFTTINDPLKALGFLEKCHQTITERFPRYILLDLNMPGFSGVEFVEKYEESYLSDHQQTEIIILTSSVREKDNEKVLSFDSVAHFISKPLSKDKLISLIAESAA